ncbi:MAG TPA: SDR family NAD(P)-dependent oxidoreductase [Actinocrinis sp.]|nr:SDR family NAD(P)-dependent oxidoreductase [Actinocrinis sp.]
MRPIPTNEHPPRGLHDAPASRTLALITGASSGIGAAYARALAPGHDLILVARRTDRLRALAGELELLGGAVYVLTADLATREGLATVTTRLAVGDVRLLISNAGTAGYARLTDLSPAEVDRLLTLNAMAPLHLARAALPGMLAAGSGAVIAVASLMAFSAANPDPRMPPRTLYCAAKAATVAFTRQLACEMAGTAIRIQVVCPGVTATEFNGGFGRSISSAMAPDDVAHASLTALRLGETVCIPGLHDQAAALSVIERAEAALLAGGNRPGLAARYTAA